MQKELKKMSFLEAYDKFILYLGKCQNENLSPAEFIRIEEDDLADKNVIPDFKSSEGEDSINKNELRSRNESKTSRFKYSRYILGEAANSKHIEKGIPDHQHRYRLITGGRHYYRKLLQLGGDTPTAFMAMKFDDKTS